MLTIRIPPIHPATDRPCLSEPIHPETDMTSLATPRFLPCHPDNPTQNYPILTRQTFPTTPSWPPRPVPTTRPTTTPARLPNPSRPSAGLSTAYHANPHRLALPGRTEPCPTFPTEPGQSVPTLPDCPYHPRPTQPDPPNRAEPGPHPTSPDAPSRPIPTCLPDSVLIPPDSAFPTQPSPT